MTTSVLLAAIGAGLLFGLSLIVAVGPQNSFVIRQGLRREHVALVVVICAASDVVLIAAGVGGVGAAVDGRAWLVPVLGVIGVAFLLGYGGLAARRAVRPRPATPAGAGEATSPATRRAVAGICLAFTWLNPGVYLDTVVLVGPVAHSHGGAAWWFATGAAIGSVLWFVALGVGAGALAPVLRRPRAERVLDASVAVIMLLTAVRIAAGLLGRS